MPPKRPEPTAPDRRVFQLWVDRPPDVLSPNARAHWSAKHRAMKSYGDSQGPSIVAQLIEQGWRSGSEPYRHCTVGSSHFFTHHVGDADNCIAVLKPLIDLLEMGTRRSGARYRVSLIKNDKDAEVLPPTRTGYDPQKGGRIRLDLEVW